MKSQNVKAEINEATTEVFRVELKDRPEFDNATWKTAYSNVDSNEKCLSYLKTSVENILTECSLRRMQLTQPRFFKILKKIIKKRKRLWGREASLMNATKSNNTTEGQQPIKTNMPSGGKCTPFYSFPFNSSMSTRHHVGGNKFFNGNYYTH